MLETLESNLVDLTHQRFFELGNNYYLGMEFPREFDLWKKTFVQKYVPATSSTDPRKQVQGTLAKVLAHHLDRLWYESCLEIIKEGDVYNPGGRSKIPDLYTIDSPFETNLGELDELDSFRLFTKTYRLVDTSGNGFSMIQGENETSSFPIPSKT